MLVKTEDLIDKALDYAVAKCEGASAIEFDGITWSFTLDNRLRVLSRGWSPSFSYCPSTDWAKGGPIIEREGISIEYRRAEFISTWIAYKLGTHSEDNPQGGETPLIAAMRAFVKSKLGDEVGVPEGLT